ncbi:C3a anaphylatoxin chemotactic receptor-like [Mantella aurantiaca]
MTNSSNESELAMLYIHYQLFTVLVLAFTTLVGIPGNALVLWITGMKMRRTVTTIWFGCLALADISCCLFIPFILVQHFYSDWLYGPALCKIIHFTVALNMFASVFTLVAISVDRCILIVHPVWAQNHRSVKMAWMICFSIWMLSFMLVLPTLIYQRTDTSNGTVSCFSEGDSFIPLNLTRAIFGFLIPLIIISACYIRLTFKAQSSRSEKVSRKTTKVALGIIVAFFITWAPYHIISIVMIFTYSGVVKVLDYFSESLALFNSCINPILYVFIGKHMQLRMRQSVRGLMESVFHEGPSTVSSRCSRSQTEESTRLEGLQE